MGHRPAVKGGYFPVPPVDSEADLRAEMLSTMGEMGLPIEKHHHEVASRQQCELGTQVHDADQDGRPDADLSNTASTTSPTATARPRPSCPSRSTATTAPGMHTHQSIWKDGKPLFAGNGYADLSEMCLYYIGGIIKHAKALNAFTNPSHQQLQAADPRLRGAGAARLLRAQPLRVLPHPLYHEPEGQARRGALPRPELPTPTWRSRR